MTPVRRRRPHAQAGALSLSLFLGFTLIAPGVSAAQGPRERTRSTRDRSTGAPLPRPSTDVTDDQATELTLTLTTVEVRQIQVWVRTGAVAEAGGRRLSAVLSKNEGALVAVGQRVRAFPPESRSSMYQARVTGVRADGDRVRVTADLAGPGRDGSRHYVLEIVTEAGDFLSIPNEAIIENEGKQLVYVRQGEGQYAPTEVRTGLQGELYTQVLAGLESGTQVVTFGSFFIDAEHKLKGS